MAVALADKSIKGTYSTLLWRMFRATQLWCRPVSFRYRSRWDISLCPSPYFILYRVSNGIWALA